MSILNSSPTGLALVGDALNSQGLAQMSMGVQRQTRREVEQVQRRAIIAKLTEDARAFITHTALEHVGALTALEQHLITIAPLGEARYREIVDSYTLGASAAIRRWN
jgi:DNA-binding TFAR19-related protein (PDSD5 family)